MRGISPFLRTMSVIANFGASNKRHGETPVLRPAPRDAVTAPAL